MTNNRTVIIVAILAIIAGMVLVVMVGHRDPELPTANSKLLDPNGKFTLFVSNQSYAIDPVDIRVTIDGELIISAYFNVGTQHSNFPFKLSLPPGTHRIRAWSVKGNAELEKEFNPGDHDVGVITYFYYPKSHSDPTPRQLNFRTQKGPLMIE